MRAKSIWLLVVVSVILLILTTEVFATGCCSNKVIKSSAQQFIRQYYKDLKKGDKAKIKKYFFESPDEESIKVLTHAGRIASHKPRNEEDFEWMIDSGKLLMETLEKIEFFELTIISQNPLIIAVGVMERYKSEYPQIPLEELFILKDIKKCEWKIIEITAPGLP